MAHIRTLPFGYRIELGAVAVHPPEAELVSEIFQAYQRGESYSQITHWLGTQSIRYHQEKPWNKNMIARILSDTRYQGEEHFPSLVSQELFEQVKERRNRKVSPCQKTPAQKLLQRYCDGPISPQIERRVLSLLNQLIVQPWTVEEPPDHHSPAPDLTVLHQTLQQEMNRPSIDAELVQQLLYRLAAARHRALGNGAYETWRIQTLLGQTDLLEELDADLLKQIVSKIHINADGSIQIHLKNGQIRKE